MNVDGSVSERLEFQVRSVIDREALIPPRALVLAAVSGGPDSMALLLALFNLGFPVCVGHLNHGLRPEAGGEAEYVEEFCESKGIPFYGGYADVAALRRAGGGGLQEVARRERYAFLERTADLARAAVIATAHTRDDQVETVLLNILRGSGTDGLAGIPYRRGRIVRPLLGTTRAEVESYCTFHHIDACRDASNMSPKYARNRVRLELMPYIRKHFGKSVDGAILRLSRIAIDEASFLDRAAETWLAGRESLDISDLQSLDAAVQRRVLRLWLNKVPEIHDLDLAQVEWIREHLDMPFARHLPGKARIVGDGTQLKMRAAGSSAPRGRPVVELPVPVPCEVEYADWSVRASGRIPDGSHVILRTFRAGDRIEFGFGHKKLSDLFGAGRIPVEERWSIPLLVDKVEGDVLAVANGRVSVRAPGLKLEATRSNRDKSTAD